jgi:hypothetical protein
MELLYIYISGLILGVIHTHYCTQNCSVALLVGILWPVYFWAWITPYIDNFVDYITR